MLLSTVNPNMYLPPSKVIIHQLEIEVLDHFNLNTSQKGRLLFQFIEWVLN